MCTYEIKSTSKATTRKKEYYQIKFGSIGPLHIIVSHTLNETVKHIHTAVCNKRKEIQRKLRDIHVYCIVCIHNVHVHNTFKARNVELSSHCSQPVKMSDEQFSFIVQLYYSCGTKKIDRLTISVCECVCVFEWKCAANWTINWQFNKKSTTNINTHARLLREE